MVHLLKNAYVSFIVTRLQYYFIKKDCCLGKTAILLWIVNAILTRQGGIEKYTPHGITIEITITQIQLKNKKNEKMEVFNEDGLRPDEVTRCAR